MASVDDQEKQSSKSWLRHMLESAIIAVSRPAGFLVPVGAAVVCVKATSAFLNALLVHQSEIAFLGDWPSELPSLRCCYAFHNTPLPPSLPLLFSEATMSAWTF